MTRRSMAGSHTALSLDALAHAIPGHACVVGDGAVRITGVRHDSRGVEPGDLFVARRGARVDGTTFAADAVRRGAAAVLADPGSAAALSSLGVPRLLVDDTGVGLAHAAEVVYGHPSRELALIGITGTNGKTTTAHLVRAALDGASSRASCGVLGTVGHTFGERTRPAEHTTPEADDTARTLAEMRELGATHVAMEVSSHGLALGRVQALCFAGAAFTNLTHDHLDFHGSMAAYGQAKATLFRELSPGFAVINVDDAFGKELSGTTAARIVRVRGVLVANDLGGADIAPVRVVLSARGTDVTFQTPQGTVRIASRLVGGHNVENLAVSLGIAFALDFNLERVGDALSKASCPPGRLERCDTSDDDIVVLVDYAHTPDALARVLCALRTGERGRIHCVFGCGGDRDALKRAPMGAVASRFADSMVITTDNPRSEDPAAIADEVARGARHAGATPDVVLDRSAAILRTVLVAAPGDIVLIAGKGHEHYQLVGATRLPFDDKLEARAALAQRRVERRKP